MEVQHLTPLVTIDLSAAFDTVDHEVLLQVLQRKFGIHGSGLKWFGSYLRPRGCKVNIGESYSHTMNLNFSVPQGSCAGPVLYLAYASTLHEGIPDDINLHGYADDHALKKSYPASDKEKELDTLMKLGVTLKEIKIWMDQNRMKMNNSKTEYIVFGGCQQLTKCTANTLNANGETTERSQKIKYLGAWLDSELTLKHQVSMKCRSAMCSLQRIKLIRHLLDVEAAHTLVRGLVLSHLDYVNAILIGLPNITIRKLQLVQDAAARVVINEKGKSAKQCRQQLHWLPIRQRIQHKILSLVFKTLKGEAPLYLQSLLTKMQPRSMGLRSTDATNKLVVPIGHESKSRDFRESHDFGP